MTTRMTLTLTSLGLAFTAQTAFADDLDDWFGGQFDTVNTSDGFKRRTVEAGYTGRANANTRYGIKASQHRLTENNVGYNATEVKLRAKTRINPQVTLSGSLGSGRVAQRHSGGNSRNLTTYHGRVEVKASERVALGLEHGKDFAFRDQILTGDDGQILSAETTKADIKYRPSKRVRLEAETSRRRLSDGNRKRESKAGAYYGISPDWPWVWTGVEVTHRDYDQKKNRYWTPQNHRSVAVVLDASFPVNDRLALNSGLSVGRSKESGVSGMSTDYFASVGADFRLNKGAKLYAKAYHVKSRQSDSNWRENAVTVGFAFDGF